MSNYSLTFYEGKQVVKRTTENGDPMKRESGEEKASLIEPELGNVSPTKV